MKRHSILKILLVSSCAIALMLCESGVMAKSKMAKSKKVSILLVLSAKYGVVSKTKSGYTLTLKGVDPQVLWFTDRPVRKAGYVSTSRYIANWKKLFGNDSPNAAIAHADMTYTKNGKNQQPRVLDLQSPKMIGENIQFVIKSYGKSFTPTTLRKVRLFIDGTNPFAEIFEVTSAVNNAFKF